MVWLRDTYERIHPSTPATAHRSLGVEGAQRQTISLQVGVRPTQVVRRISVSFSGDYSRHASARLAGLVPVLHHTTSTAPDLLDGQAPGFVADPLMPLEGQALDANVSRSIWITLRLPVKAGTGKLCIAVRLDDGPVEKLHADVTVWPFRLPRLELPVTNWFYSDALCDWYRVEPFSKRYWELVEGYFENLVDHHQTAIYTPLFTPPLDNKKRDLQLVDVMEISRGRFRFGWAKLKRWIEIGKRAGFRFFEMSHLFSQWGAAYAIRILVNRNGKIVPLCKPQTPATGKVYRNFLEQFLPALLKFLEQQRILDRCIFHLSDEPGTEHLQQYRDVREMVRKIAPGLRNTEALSHVDFFKEGLIDNPVPVISNLPEFLDAGINPWVYYCCNPRGPFPNRFLDYPLHRLRILGPMMARWKLAGFLHWGCNYWYRGGTTELINPFQVTDAHRWPDWAAGDPFILYPGPDGPIDSIRWEIFREAFDDYRLLRLVESRKGRDAITPLLDPIRSPADFPQSPDYLRQMRRSLANLLG